VAGHARAMRAIAPGMSPDVSPRQGRRRPTPRFRAAGEVINFALVAVYGLINCSVGRVVDRAGDNARHRLKHTATPLPLAGSPEAYAVVLCRRHDDRGCKSFPCAPGIMIPGIGAVS
jgi:hypothetical protein